MDTAQFWSIIEKGCPSGSTPDRLASLSAILASLRDSELLGFYHQMVRLHDGCYRWDFRAAVIVMAGEDTTEDTISGLIGWLMLQGQTTFEKVLANLDLLAELPVDVPELHTLDLLGWVIHIYESREAGRQAPDEDGYCFPDKPAGRPLTLEELPEVFPKLCNRFDFELES